MRCPLAWGSSLAVIGAVVAALAGCATPTTYQSAVKDEWPHFGHDVAPSSVETVAVAAVVATEVPFLVEGTIKEVCQTKGCWMVVADGSGHDLLVRFQDYGFFVPRNAMGRRTVIHGVAEETTYSVEILQHLASDAGKSSEEIAAITEPRTTLTFFADSVWIQGSGLIEVYRPVGQESCPPVPPPPPS